MPERFPAENRKMADYLRTLPGQVLQGYAIGAAVKLPPHYLEASQILFCGVGGSAIGMDILAQAMKNFCRVPFQVHRGEGLPRWAGPRTLVVLTSYSGDTAETLHALEEALGRKSRILCVTSGGRLQKLAEQKKLPCVRIPEGMPPRTAVGYLTFALAAVMAKGRWIQFSARDAERTQSSAAPIIARAEALARQLKNKMVFLYGDGSLFEVTLKRWRAQLAENAKTLCSANVMPEMFHNEIEGWKNPGFLPARSAVVCFRDSAESPAYRKKTDLALRLIKNSGAQVITLRAPREGLPLEKAFSLIALGDWVSFELAKLYGEDPVDIPVIRKIKTAG